MEGEEPRFCTLAECGEQLVRGQYETKQNWEKRETCNRSCAAKKTRQRKKRK